MATISERFPDVARQIREEVSQGTDGRQEADSIWYPKPARSRSSEITTRQYSDDERLEILLTALVALGRTALESRRSVRQLFGDNSREIAGNYRITFVDTDTDENVMTMSAQQLGQDDEIAAAVNDLEQVLRAVTGR